MRSTVPGSSTSEGSYKECLGSLPLFLSMRILSIAHAESPTRAVEAKHSSPPQSECVFLRQMRLDEPVVDVREGVGGVAVQYTVRWSSCLCALNHVSRLVHPDKNHTLQTWVSRSLW